MANLNRRTHKRLKIDRNVKVPVQVAPLMPFIGDSMDTGLLNISAGGMALVAYNLDPKSKIKKGLKIKVHFHIPGRPLQECRGVVTHRVTTELGHHVLGIRFKKLTQTLVYDLNKMVSDNGFCDQRIRDHAKPWCDISCAFHSLCRKPIRVMGESNTKNRIEIVLQTFEGVRPV